MILVVLGVVTLAFLFAYVVPATPARMVAGPHASRRPSPRSAGNSASTVRSGRSTCPSSAGWSTGTSGSRSRWRSTRWQRDLAGAALHASARTRRRAGRSASASRSGSSPPTARALGPVRDPRRPPRPLRAALLVGPDADVLPRLQALGVPAQRRRSPLIWYLILPSFTLGVGGAAFYSRMMRTTMLEVLRSPYIEFARLKGMPERTILFRHALRHALTPVITMIGMDLGYFLGGVLIIESVFGLPGVGQLAYNAIGELDIPMITGTVLVAAVFMVVMNFIVDVPYTVIDPRVRLRRGLTRPPRPRPARPPAVPPPPAHTLHPD